MKLHPATLIAAILGGALTRRPEPTPEPVATGLPPGEEWHNPDNLTPAQVGDGYRLLTKTEQEACVFHNNAVPTFHRWNAELLEWEGGQLGIDPARTYRAHASLFFLGHDPAKTHAAPAEAWKLPEPPAGRAWCGKDWRAQDLPPGYRPLLVGEVEQEGDEDCTVEGQREFKPAQTRFATSAYDGCLTRTKRPLPADAAPAPKVHNPAGLTPEQVGEGYRLLNEGEIMPEGYEFWYTYEGAWRSDGSYAGFTVPHSNHNTTVRVRVEAAPAALSTDPYAALKAAYAAGKVIEVWQEETDKWIVLPREPRWNSARGPAGYRIAEPAKLPELPEGREWVEGTLRASDLPPGYRPMMRGERIEPGDEAQDTHGEWSAMGADFAGYGATSHQRTKRPLESASFDARELSPLDALFVIITGQGGPQR